MVPETPPRRSKATTEPVTIDLTAEESSTVAEPVRANDSDEPVTVAGQAVEASADAEKPASAESISEPDTAGLSVAEEASASETQAEVAEQPETAAGADTASAQDIRKEPKPATFAAEPEPMPATPVRTSPATTTLIAAGIFGGIVALLLAGSMQYAGYLPSSTRAPAAGTTNMSAELTELRQEIAALRNRPAATPDASLANRIAALETSTRSQTGAASEQALAALRSEVDRLRATVQSTASADATLTRRMDQAEAKINDRGPEQQVARAVAAAALKAAIDRGGQFQTELQTFATVAGDDPAVAGLRTFAANGVPSRAELQRDFPRVADAMLEATVQADPNEGVMGRLMSSAMSVVKVRRVGDVRGDTPEAIVARMEEALRSGNLQASADQWNTLPEPAKAASQSFKQRLDARIQVENLVSGTLTRAVAGTQG